VLAGLDPEQRAVAVAPRGPVCVLAGAGTGKTRALTHRIAFGVHSGQVDAARVLSLTFTARAAGELRGRLRGLQVDGVQARTIHAAALRQLRYFWPQVIGGEPPTVLAQKAALVAEAASRLRVRVDRTALRDLASEIEWAKVSQIAPDDYPAAAVTSARVMPADLPPGEVARVYAAYDDVKRGRGQIDFEDVLLLTAGMLDDDSRMATSVRSQYQHLLVDEYQDVSPAQQRLIDLWLGDGDDLTVVGDAAQTIYSFTGASPRFLTGFAQRYPQATVVRLVRDYRSTPQVVGLANRVLASAVVAPELRLTLVAQRPDGPEPAFVAHPDEPAEAADVVVRIKRLIAAGTPAREIAVLYRVNAQSEVYEEELARCGVDYVVRGGERFFERPEVREAVTLLRGSLRAGESVAADESLTALVSSVLATAGYSAAAPSGQGSARTRWESLAALVALAGEVSAVTPDAGLAEFVAVLDERAAMQHAPTVDGVTLASLHAAKGLEWDAVFLVGLVDGTVPITYATTPAQVEEERRLLYVGITRAREHLTFSWATARNPGSRGQRRPSRFLDGLRPGEATATAGRTSGAGSRRRKGAARCRVCGRALTTAVERKLRHCSECEVDVDLELFERLREWRREEAQRTSVPAYVVFTDVTLTAIAQDRPSSEVELVGVPGVGPSKLARYGPAVLAVVAGEWTGHADVE